MSLSKVRCRPPKESPKPGAEELRKAEMQAEIMQQQKLWELREELSTLSFAELRGAHECRRRSLRFLSPTPDVISDAIHELCAIEDVIQDKAKALVLAPIPDSIFRILRSQE